MLPNYMLLFSLAVSFAILTQIYGYNEERIKNSVITPKDLFNFTVNVYGNGGCSASIISPRHVLIAAHCNLQYRREAKEKIDNKRGYIVYERNYDLSGRKKINSFNRLYFPSYGWHDISVLEYPEGTNLTDIGVPVKLAKDYVEKKGDEAYIAGYGNWWIDSSRKIGPKRSGGSKVLRHTQVTMLTSCFGYMTVCGGNWTHHALSGDSGGPMLINRMNQWFQIGVSATAGGHDTRARVPSYCNFIEEVTKNEVKCQSIYPENYLNGQLLPLKHFEPIYKGQSTPLKLFDFVVPLYNYYYKQGCTATVISKRHLLTSAKCVYRYSYHNVNKKLNITDHSKSYKTLTGKMFPDFRSKNVQSSLKNPVDVIAYFPYWYKWPNTHNLAVVEFPEGTNFEVEPVTLANDYFAIYMDNETIIVAGYGDYTFTEDVHVKESTLLLQHSNDVPRRQNMENRKVANEKLQQDEGGPMIIERNGKFYQIGVNYVSNKGGGFHESISFYCHFIENVTKNEIKCESALPLYDRPSSNAPKMNQFQMATLLITLLILFCV